MILWKWRTYNDLTTDELYDILALRQEVFILEQKSFYIDLDYRDQESLHLLGLKDNKLAAYLRVLPKNKSYPEAMSFGRVVTAPFARGQGIGKKLIEEALQHFKKNYPDATIIISAQLYLEKFYRLYGFVSMGEPYDEDGILHIDMKKVGA